MSDKPDIVERLREQVSPLKRENLPGSADLCIEAAEEIKRLRSERDGAVRALNQITNAPYCAFVRNGWIERMVFVEIGLTYEFMEDCPDHMVETIAKEIKNAMLKATKPTNDWIQVNFKQEDGK